LELFEIDLKLSGINLSSIAVGDFLNVMMKAKTVSLDLSNCRLPKPTVFELAMKVKEMAISNQEHGDKSRLQFNINVNLKE
jgi:hypothetical protein